ncbi:MAG TPA: TerC family protein, partial [Micromonosporaceae bacterium]
MSGGFVFTHFSLATWLVTIAALVVIVIVDMVVIARRQRAVTLRDSVMWVALYVSLAAIFAVLLFVFAPSPAGGQFVAGYITEYVLSVDNLLVFVIIMSRFAVPLLAQDKALYVGIVGSMCLRAVFIIIGAGAVALASWVFYIFGAAL